MKSLFLATAAVAALVAAPALAQDGVGSLGVNYARSSLDAFGLEGDFDAAPVDLALAADMGAFTVTIDSAVNYSLDDAIDNGVSARIHGSKAFGDFRAGAFFGTTEVLGDYMQTYGAEGQYYLDQMTLSGSVAYETLDDVEVDSWSVAGDVAYFISPNFRVNGGLGWSNFESGGADTSGWQADIGGEYKFADTPFGVTAAFNHAELEDIDLSIDTFMVGVRLSFGGDLQTRDRKGGDLGRSAAGIGAVAAMLN